MSKTKRVGKNTNSAFFKIRKHVPIGDVPFKDKTRYDRKNFKQNTQDILRNLEEEEEVIDDEFEEDEKR